MNLKFFLISLILFNFLNVYSLLRFHGQYHANAVLQSNLEKETLAIQNMFHHYKQKLRYLQVILEQKLKTISEKPPKYSFVQDDAKPFMSHWFY